MENLYCETCQAQRTSGKFCWHCGLRLTQAKTYCRSCGSEVEDPSDRFCRECGARADWEVRPIAARTMPTVAELERILNSEPETPVHINDDGSISPMSAC